MGCRLRHAAQPAVGLVNAFDPLKLMDTQFGDPNRVAIRFAGGIRLDRTPPEMLATAQQMAGINRRLVTTDSYDLPVTGGTIRIRALLRWERMALPGVLATMTTATASKIDFADPSKMNSTGRTPTTSARCSARTCEGHDLRLDALPRVAAGARVSEVEAEYDEASSRDPDAITRRS